MDGGDLQPFGRTAGATALAPLVLVKESSGLVVTAAKTDKPAGLHAGRETPAAGRANIYVSGVRKAIAAAAIAVDAELMPAAAGRVITHDDSTGAYYVGRAVTAAGAAGEEFYILLYDRPFPKPA